MKKISKKLTVLLVAGIIFLVATEGILYLAGRIYYSSRTGSGTEDLRSPGSLRILCLGDSFTFGMGAQRGYSYPEQLRRILQERNAGKAFDVYNIGVPANTSSKVLRELQKGVLEKFDPEIVVILIGLNDTYRDIPGYFVKRRGLPYALYLVEKSMDKSRVGRLLKLGVDKLLVSVWKWQIQTTYQAYFAESPSKGLNACSGPEALARQYQEYLLRASQQFNQWQRNQDQAIELFNQAITLMPQCDQAYLGLAFVYDAFIDQKGYPDAEFVSALIEKAVKINPRTKKAFWLLWHTYYRSGKILKARQALDKYLFLSPEEIPQYLMIYKYGLAGFQEGNLQLSEYYRRNLEAIVEKVQGKGARAVLIPYPEGAESFSKIASEVAFEKNAMFVDLLASFKKLERKPEYRRNDYFVPDGHCTAKGYAVMAHGIALAIEENFLK